jgi:hypothetical protein
MIISSHLNNKFNRINMYDMIIPSQSWQFSLTIKGPIGEPLEMIKVGWKDKTWSCHNHMA